MDNLAAKPITVYLKKNISKLGIYAHCGKPSPVGATIEVG